MIRLSDDLKMVVMVIGLLSIIVYFAIILCTKSNCVCLIRWQRASVAMKCALPEERKRNENDVVFTVRVIVGG